MPRKSLLFCLLSGALLSVPWFINVPGIVLLIAFIPLLKAEQHLTDNKKFYSSRVAFVYASITFFTWNILSMWWVTNISFWAALLAISANTLLYSLVFWVFHIVKRINGKRLGALFFVVIWLAFEYYCLHAEFAQPWLILGNGLANTPVLIQWYSATGAMGGSLWILSLNLLIFELISEYQHTRMLNRSLVLFLILIAIIPTLLSVISYLNPETKQYPCKVALIQPNIDPYTVKFDSTTKDKQMATLMQLADSAKGFNTDYYVAPETAVDDDIWENALMNNYSLFQFRNFINQQPKASFILGAVTYREFKKYEKAPPEVRFDKINRQKYVIYNSALQIDETLITQVYHKSKLVLGVEKAPFPKVLSFLKNHLVNLGGINVSYGTQENRSVFTNKNNSGKIAPVICFESVYGSFVTNYIKQGANAIFILTNDGWWKNSNGYAQHLQIARLRAIETQRYIARCANTGISAFIDTKGRVLQATEWWTPDVITGTIYLNNLETFYVRNGDYLGRISIFLVLAIIMVSFTRILRRKKSV